MKGVMTGLRAWLVQRITAAIILGLLLLFFIRLALEPFKTYQAWSQWMSEPLVSVAVALFFSALLLHAWVGLRDVILDYVHNTALRLLAYSVVIMGYGGVAFWLARILLR